MDPDEGFPAALQDVADTTPASRYKESLKNSGAIFHAAASK
jgi:hypothetical protein